MPRGLLVRVSGPLTPVIPPPLSHCVCAAAGIRACVRFVRHPAVARLRRPSRGGLTHRSPVLASMLRAWRSAPASVPALGSLGINPSLSLTSLHAALPKAAHAAPCTAAVVYHRTMPAAPASAAFRGGGPPALSGGRRPGLSRPTACTSRRRGAKRRATLCVCVHAQSVARRLHPRRKSRRATLGCTEANVLTSVWMTRSGRSIS